MNKVAFSFLREVINDFNVLIEQIPDNAFNYCSRGILRFSVGDDDGALADWNRASRMGCEASCFLLKEKVNSTRNTVSENKKKVL